MFNIGLIEFLIIFFFLVLLVKPEDIPKVSKNLGLFYRKLSRYFFNIKYELSDIENNLSQNNKNKKQNNEISKPSKRTKKQDIN